MNKRFFKGKNPWTFEQYERLSKNSLESILPTLETVTIHSMDNTLDNLQKSNGSLSEAQQCLDRVIFWELYNRENAEHEHQKWVTPDDDKDQAVNHDRRRSIHAQRVDNVKQLRINEKRRLKREAAIAQECRHTGDSKPKKPQNAASRKLDPDDVVDPTHLLLCDVHAERDQDWKQDCLLASLLAENADPWEPYMNPMLWYLRTRA